MSENTTKLTTTNPETLTAAIEDLAQSEAGAARLAAHAAAAKAQLLAARANLASLERARAIETIQASGHTPTESEIRAQIQAQRAHDRKVARDRAKARIEASETRESGTATVDVTPTVSPATIAGAVAKLPDTIAIATLAALPPDQVADVIGRLSTGRVAAIRALASGTLAEAIDAVTGGATETKPAAPIKARASGKGSGKGAGAPEARS